MQITKPKAIMQKALPLFLSLAMLAGLLPVSPLGTMLIKDAEARAAARGPRGGAAVAGPRGAAAVGPRGNAVAATPRSYVHTGSCLGGRGSPPSLRRRPPGRSRLMWAHGGQPLEAPTAAARLSVPCQWVPGPWLLPGPPTMWPAGFITVRSMRGARWSTSRWRTPKPSSDEAIVRDMPERCGISDFLLPVKIASPEIGANGLR